jgi:hypothetical protein
MNRDNRVDRREDRGAHASTAAPIVLVGGLVLLVGAFLDWASGAEGAAQTAASGGSNVDVSGYNLPDGRLAFGIGLALVIMAALMWTNKRVGSWFDSDLLGVALSTIAVGVIVTFLMDLGNGGRSADLGAYVSLVGAIIALAGAAAALLRSGSDRASSDREGHGDVDARRTRAA